MRDLQSPALENPATKVIGVIGVIRRLLNVQLTEWVWTGNIFRSLSTFIFWKGAQFGRQGIRNHSVRRQMLTSRSSHKFPRLFSYTCVGRVIWKWKRITMQLPFPFLNLFLLNTAFSVSLKKKLYFDGWLSQCSLDMIYIELRKLVLRH